MKELVAHLPPFARRNGHPLRSTFPSFVCSSAHSHHCRSLRQPSAISLKSFMKSPPHDQQPDRDQDNPAK